MSRPRNPVPAYSFHKPSGQAYVRVPDGIGGRKVVYLGKHGTEASRLEYRRVLAELPARAVPLSTTSANITVNELLLAFIRHAENHYRRPDGSQTPEVGEYKALSRTVRELYGNTPAREFGPLALKTVRQQLVAAGACRSLVNQRIGRLKRVFKFAAAEELIPFEVFNRLTTVAGLQRGRSDAPESEPVGPVADEHVDAALPFLTRHVRGLVELQRLTGCRPGEACGIRRADIDTGGAIWLYRPKQHKSAWRGKPRVIAIGPRAQILLREFFTPNLDDYLFSPRRSMEEFRAGQRAKRTSAVQPSQQNRKRRTPKKTPTERYSSRSYAQSVADACVKAGVPHWHPNQLRHTHATKVRKTFGLESAGASLGHTKMSATEIYAERDAGLALEVAAKIG